MAVKQWWSNEKAKWKQDKKTFVKWVGIALGVIVAALVIYAIVVAVHRAKVDKQATLLEAQANALNKEMGIAGGARAFRAYKIPEFMV